MLLWKEKLKRPRFLSFQFCLISKIENLEISELCLLLQILTEIVTPDIKRTRNELREKLEGSDMRYQKKKKENSRDLKVLDFALYPRKNLRNLYFNSNFDSSCD